jgi:hypothetical protein
VLIAPAQGPTRKPHTQAIHVPVQPGPGTLPTHGTATQTLPEPGKADPVHAGDGDSPPHAALQQRHARFTAARRARHTGEILTRGGTPNSQDAAVPDNPGSPPVPSRIVPVHRRAQVHDSWPHNSAQTPLDALASGIVNPESNFPPGNLTQD